MKNPIKMFFQCKLCMADLMSEILEPEQLHVSAGFDRESNIVVWCNRHNILITLIKREMPIFSKN